MSESVIAKKAFIFALNVLKLYQSLNKNREYVISRQILKSATSIGANVEEARAAISKKDFIVKISIASKEARETRYWLKLLNTSHLINYDYTILLQEIDELNRLLTSTVKTAQENLKLS